MDNLALLKIVKSQNKRPFMLNTYQTRNLTIHTKKSLYGIRYIYSTRALLNLLGLIPNPKQPRAFKQGHQVFVLQVQTMIQLACAK